jgi:hypothetical protein
MPATELGSTLEAALNQKKSLWNPLTKDSPVPKGEDDFFLVRPRGTHPAHDKPFTPSVVQISHGELYTATDELRPVTWSRNGDMRQGPTQDPYQADLEWCPIPQ